MAQITTDEAKTAFGAGDFVGRDAVAEMLNGVARGTQANAITSVPTAGSATAADNATAINSILAALRTFGVIAT